MAGSASFLGSVRRFFRDYLLVMETRGSFGQLVQKATEDLALRQRLLQAPKQVLAEAGITLPAGLEVEVVENTDKVIHLVLPPLVEVSEAGGGAQ
jgi:Nitrile hydratase, alpha chain